MLNALVNGTSVEQISIQDRAIQYGDGVFETMPLYQGSALWFNQHYDRLQQGCTILKITAPKKELLLNDIGQLTTNQKTESAVLKIIVTRGKSERGYVLDREVQPTRILASYAWQNKSQSKTENGIRLKLCDSIVSRHPVLGGIKHLNRLENVLARQEWQGDEYDEGLMCDEFGYVVDGIMSNIFLCKNNKVYTPKIKYSGVKGIMRGWILEQHTKWDMNEVEKITLEQLRQADEIFMTNSLIGMWPVREFNNKQYTTGPVFRSLYKKLKMEYPVLNV